MKFMHAMFGPQSSVDGSLSGALCPAINVLYLRRSNTDVKVSLGGLQPAVSFLRSRSRPREEVGQIDGDCFRKIHKMNGCDTRVVASMPATFSDQGHHNHHELRRGFILHPAPLGRAVLARCVQMHPCFPLRHG